MKRNKFSLSHYKLMSCDMGELVPCGLVEVLPGDAFQMATSALIRVSPLLAPVMHPVHVKVHHWFVPHRIIWEDFEDFITGGPDGLDASVFPTVTMDATTGAVGELGDYLGVPTGNVGLEVSALPFRAYNLIFNEWYRDQDLETELALSVASGADVTTALALQNVAWEKDYFTSARPWTQKGPEVTLPLSGNAPVKGIGPASQASTTGSVVARESGESTPSTFTDYWQSPTFYINDSDADDYPDIFADLSGVAAATVNELRLALALQRYEEVRARYGSRYSEYLRHLGIVSSDARLQRPEYLGGGRQTIQFSEVLQTAEGATSSVGELKGHGISAMRTNRFRRFFEEHGYVVSLLSVKPKTMYAQGSPRTWNRRVKEDFHQKELEHIGQQEVLNKEVYAAAASPDGVFGYQDRYDEYRREASCIAGEFRSSVLDFWHMARLFASEPALNADFIKSTPTDRIYATSTNDVLWVMANHSIQARRQLSKVGKSYIF